MARIIPSNSIWKEPGAEANCLFVSNKAQRYRRANNRSNYFYNKLALRYARRSGISLACCWQTLQYTQKKPGEPGFFNSNLEY